MCASMSAVIIDAREVFGDLQRTTRAQRFKAELAAFERQCSDRARTFVDMLRSRGLGATASPVGYLFYLADGRRPARSGLRLASGQNIVRPPREHIRERLGTSRSGGDGTTWGRRAYANLSRFRFRSSATLLQFPKIPVSPQAGDCAYLAAVCRSIPSALAMAYGVSPFFARRARRIEATVVGWRALNKPQR